MSNSEKYKTMIDLYRHPRNFWAMINALNSLNRGRGSTRVSKQATAQQESKETT